VVEEPRLRVLVRVFPALARLVARGGFINGAETMMRRAIAFAAVAAAPATAGNDCNHNNGNHCCTVKGVGDDHEDYVGPDSYDRRWGNNGAGRIVVEECYGPSGPRQTSGLSPQWGGVDYHIKVNHCCLDGGCGIILMIHGLGPHGADGTEDGMHLDDAAGASGDAGPCGNPNARQGEAGWIAKRFIVVHAQSRVRQAGTGYYTWLANWKDQDARTHK